LPSYPEERSPEADSAPQVAGAASSSGASADSKRHHRNQDTEGVPYREQTDQEKDFVPRDLSSGTITKASGGIDQDHEPANGANLNSP
jgi:hypothetical protein